MKKLIKISKEYFIIAEDSKVKESEYGVGFAEGIKGVGRGWNIFYNDGSKLAKLNSICEKTYKITHSTQPIEHDFIPATYGDQYVEVFDVIKQLNLLAVNDLIGCNIETEWNVEFDKNNKLKLK